MKILVIGCGYIGLPLAQRWLAEGNEVTAWVHSPTSAEALREHPFSKVVVGSVGDEDLWKDLPSYDYVLHCASSGRGGAEAYREVFLQGATWLALYQPDARRWLVSSTSVYGQTQGEVVIEESAAEPSTETGQVLRKAEELALTCGIGIVRSSGIYGPGRGVLFEKLRRGEAVIEGDGQRWMNQIHRDDLVAAIAFLVARGQLGEIYNASDDTPVTTLDFFTWSSAFLGLPLPPYGPVNPNRKRGLSSKRVSTAKLRALGWAPQYPSFREGLAALAE